MNDTFLSEYSRLFRIHEIHFLKSKLICKYDRKSKSHDDHNRFN